jgi:hypothetical protein
VHEPESDKVKSDVFSLGMTLLSASILRKLPVYNFETGEINH